MRHGRSRADDEAVHEGRYDSPLTEVGRAQAVRRAEEFVRLQHPVARIIASPVELDDGWMERDNGPLAGMAFDDTSYCRLVYLPRRNAWYLLERRVD